MGKKNNVKITQIDAVILNDGIMMGGSSRQFSYILEFSRIGAFFLHYVSS